MNLNFRRLKLTLVSRGSRLLVVGPDDDEEDLEEEVMSDLENLLSRVSKTGRGVSVQASTLGSLEALLEFLRVSKIPVSNVSVGPVWKRDGESRQQVYNRLLLTRNQLCKQASCWRKRRSTLSCCALMSRSTKKPKPMPTK